ncbi:hypothetical protein F4802DRAFT_555159 [Xylaria palmicola]|nr:hypothetical protein F4802DRAFT_555159 [Xylaria palmicola]
MPAITLQQIQDDPGRKDLFGILNGYIQPESATPASKAAASFTHSVQATDEDFFRGFWADVFSVAEQIPHDSPAQDKLAALVRELTLVPETGDTVWEARVWTDLPLLGASIRDHLDRVPATGARVSFHALVARLLHAGVSPGSETTAVWMLRDALEQDGAAGPGADLALMTAAVYVEYAGATLAQTLALRPAPALDDAQRRLLRGGALWKDKSGLTVDRWRFWGQRFRARAASATAPEARGLALHAARLIEVWTETRLSRQ